MKYSHSSKRFPTTSIALLASSRTAIGSVPAGYKLFDQAHRLFFHEVRHQIDQFIVHLRLRISLSAMCK